MLITILFKPSNLVSEGKNKDRIMKDHGTAKSKLSNVHEMRMKLTVNTSVTSI